MIFSTPKHSKSLVDQARHGAHPGAHPGAHRWAPLHVGGARGEAQETNKHLDLR